MFGGRQTPGSLISPDIGPRQSRHQLRISAEGSDIDNRIARIVIDVDYWIKINADSDRLRLFAGDPARLVSQVFAAGRTHCHRARQSGCAYVTVSHPSFKVRGDKQRDSG